MTRSPERPLFGYDTKEADRREAVARKRRNRADAGSGFRCPQEGCGGAAYVVDSRPSEGGGVSRRRECRTCGHRFTTREDIDGSKREPEEGAVSRAARRMVLRVLANLPREVL